MFEIDILKNLKLPEEVGEILSACPGYQVATSIKELVDLSCGNTDNGWHEVEYEVRLLFTH